MALPMARPWKHPDSGVYWLRKRVPDDLRELIGKNEERLSLRTREPDEAKRRHAKALAELEVRWANLRHGAQSLSEREAIKIVQDFCDGYIDYFAQHDGRDRQWPSAWPCDDAIRKFISPSGWFVFPKPEAERRRAAEALVDGYLVQRGLLVAPDERSLFVEMLIEALDDLIVFLGTSTPSPIKRRSRFIRERDHDGARLSPLSPQAGAELRTARPGRRQANVSFDEVFSGWIKEKQPREKTQYMWRKVVDQLRKFIGHSDAVRLTADDLIRWKAELLEEGLRPKTIRDGKLAPIRAILQWAVDNRKLPTNAAERITIDLRAKLTERKRGYTEEEARKVLTAARSERDPLRRWVPWLCAFIRCSPARR